jgi:predicted TPR repeat methyltransferase
MAQQKLDMATVRQLHQEGNWDEARTGYLTLLKSNPKDVDVLHALAILCAQEDKLKEAEAYLQTAIQLQPKNPVLYLHLANIFKIQGLFDDAIRLLQKVIVLDPNCISAYNNLGSVYFAQGNFSQAIQTFRQTLEKQPDYVDAHYNLGLALIKNHEIDAAIKLYEELLKHAPQHFAARFHLGCLLMQQEKMTAAEKQFLIITESQPHHFETQSNLATCYLKLGNLKAAKQYYLNALALMPKDTQILFNLGVIESQLGNIDQTIQYYQQAVKTNPDFFEAHNNLGAAFIFKQHAGLALHHFKEALRLQPNNEALQYTVNALSKNQLLLAAPPSYITTLFDAYADHYDAHLTLALDYKVPELLYDAIRETKMIPQQQWDILDLGCGTGLCGTLFKSAAKQLIGVDLSTNMLDIAKQKNSYDELILEDFIVFLKNKKSQYDLIMAGDALVYTGDLDMIFAETQQALREQGLLVFNAEICTDVEYKMNQSGRFAHHKQYIDSLAEKYHFDIVHYKPMITRLQNNEPVQGHIYVLQKRSGFKSML